MFSLRQLKRFLPKSDETEILSVKEVIHIKIKEKIKKWLFSAEIQRINQLEKQIEESTNRLRLASIQLGNSEKEIEECRRLLTQFIDIGVDVGFHSDDHSWAVICIAGKPEYVKFMPLAHKDAKCVLDFLKQFQYSRQVIDSPFAFREMVRDRILR